MTLKTISSIHSLSSQPHAKIHFTTVPPSLILFVADTVNLCFAVEVKRQHRMKKAGVQRESVETYQSLVRLYVFLQFVMISLGNC